MHECGFGNLPGLLGYGFITHFEDPQAKLFYSSLRVNHGGSSSILNDEGESLQMVLVLLHSRKFLPGPGLYGLRKSSATESRHPLGPSTAQAELQVPS